MGDRETRQTHAPYWP